jgi:hypothetical protein
MHLVRHLRTLQVARARLVLLAVAVPLVALVGASPASASARHLSVTSTPPSATGPLNAAQRHLLQQGYLVPKQAAYDSAKARAARRAPGSAAAHAAALAVRVPTANPSFAGLRDPNVGPPDTTGAVGTTRFIETINDKYAIYQKSSTSPLASGSLTQLWNSGGATTTDPQMMWDPGTKRFYYLGLILVSNTDNRLTFGFSKTASPSSASDFCHYFITYGKALPDYPKLGDTRDFTVFGTNTFSNSSPGGTYIGSDILALTKPPSGTTCPAASSFTLASKLAVQNQDGTQAFTPEPANQTDTSKAGYVAAVDGKSPSTHLTLFKISTAADGSAKIPTKGTNLSVPSYSPPPSAPQQGTVDTLDTLDGRLTQAVSAIDPSRGASGEVALWTQHTVAGGAGSEVRWYEIDPAAKALFQSGKATSASLYEFNGGISPNRVVGGGTKAFGADMAMSFNASSSSAHPSIQAVSKIGAGAQSAPIVVKSSSDSLQDFTCTPTCRWGDYAGATPDPSPPAGSSRVWMVNEWVAEPGSLFGSGWGTWNFAITP